MRSAAHVSSYFKKLDNLKDFGFTGTYVRASYSLGMCTSNKFCENKHCKMLAVVLVIIQMR